MYYINKIVGWVLSPMGVLFLGLAAGWAAGGVKGLRGAVGLRRLRGWIVGVTLGVFWVLGCGVTTRLIGVPLEGEEVPVVDTLDVGGYDAVVLLGGGMGVHAKCGRAEMFNGADRVWRAAQLWKAHNDGSLKITLTSEDVAISTTPLLKDLGVDEKAIVYFPEARNTEEEAELIAKSGIKRIMLVTSAWHMPRAKMLFERKGFDVTPKPTDYEMHCAAEQPIRFGDFFPSADALMRNGWAVKEWVARFCYWIKG